MEIVRTGNMPDGTQIQLEDWSKNYNGVINVMIGAYPVARNSVGNWIKGGEKFRLSLSRFGDFAYANMIFDKLVAGKITFAELKDHFWNTYKDEFLLGLITFEEYCEIESGTYEAKAV